MYPCYYDVNAYIFLDMPAYDKVMWSAPPLTTFPSTVPEGARYMFLLLGDWGISSQDRNTNLTVRDEYTN